MSWSGGTRGTRDVTTPEQAAEYPQLSPDYVFRLIRGHKLAASRIGRTYRIPKEGVESFLLANSTRPKLHEAMVRRVLDIAERNPEVSSDDILEELEAMDEEAKCSRASRG